MGNGTKQKRSGSLASQAKSRDLYICQCCYKTEDGMEAHHIEPLAMGGADDLTNLVTLCKLCHDHVPLSPDDFLEYQRNGGAVWMSHLMSVASKPENNHMSMEKIKAVLSFHRDEVFAASLIYRSTD